MTCISSHDSAKRECDLLTSGIEALIMKAFGSLPFFSKPMEALNKIWTL